jgi:hypothetical protein
MDLSNYKIDELVELKNTIINMIDGYSDGYIYICKIRSYGRNWNDRGVKNTHTLQELCYRYDGDDGVVDVYSTNPDLSNIHNYGALKYIKSVDDYEKWRAYERLKRDIPEYEKEWEEWDNIENISFRERRSYFKPILSKDDIEAMKKQLEEYDMSFTPPKNYDQ